MSGRGESLRERRLFRLGWLDSSGKLCEALDAFFDHAEMIRALPEACDARKASGEPQFSVVIVYKVETVAPIVILLDEASN